jgi:arabinofuranosyltransferase
MKRWRLNIYEYSLILVGVFLVFKSKWICDDGYIFFRYVDNLVVHKIGLVFNRGEFVEGFTSPFWVFLLSIIRFFFRSFSLRHLTIIASLIIALMTFYFLALMNRRHLAQASNESESHRLDLNFSLPLVFTISTRVAIDFFTSGLETPLVMLYAVLVASLILQPPRRIAFVGLIAGVGPLIRPDLALFSLVLLIHYFWIMKGKDWIKVILLAGLPYVFYEVFRVWYYASFLPNTYYTKASSGANLLQGYFYFLDLIGAYHTHILFFVFAAFVLILFAKKGSRYARRAAQNRIFLILAILLYASYVFYIGGDYMHGRFWLPCLILLYAGFSGLIEPMIWSIIRKYKGNVVLAKGLTPLVILAVLLIRMPMRSIQKGEERPRLIMNEREWQSVWFDRKDIGTWIFEPDNITVRQGTRMKELSQILKKPIPNVHTMLGYLGYYAGPDVEIIDKLGLTNVVAARMKIRGRGYPGHEKWAPGAYLLTRHPMFWETPFEAYNEEFSFFPEFSPVTNLDSSSSDDSGKPKGLYPVTNLDPSFLDAIGSILHSDLREKTQTAINKILSKNEIDPNLLFLLKKLTASWQDVDPKLVTRIDNAYRTLAGSKCSWESWLQVNEDKLNIMESQVRNTHHLIRNISIAAKSWGIKFDQAD